MIGGAATPNQRSGGGEGSQQDDQHARGEQKQVPQTQTSRMSLLGLAQVANRRELDLANVTAADQVDNDRDQRRQRRQPQYRIEEADHPSRERV